MPCANYPSFKTNFLDNDMNKPGPKPEPKPSPPKAIGKPKCPKSLSPEAKAKWREMTDLLDKAGILSMTDADALELYCVLYCRWQEAEAKVKAEGPIIVTPSGYARSSPWLRIATDTLKDLKGLLLEFGLTPVSRKRVPVEAPEEIPDKWAIFEN